MGAGADVPVSPGLLLEGRYRLDHRIAAGAMGEVWRATDLVLDRPVAVKLLRPGYAGHEEAWPGSVPRPGMRDCCPIRASRRYTTTGRPLHRILPTW